MRLLIHFDLIDRHYTLGDVWMLKGNLAILLIYLENNKGTYDL